jgi:hypothetical protein
MDWIDMFVLFGYIAATADRFFSRLLLLFLSLSEISKEPFTNSNPFPLFHVSLHQTIQALSLSLT